jgi:hypothetical protein
MLHPRQVDKPFDADDLMTGKCGTCGHVAELPRWQALAPDTGPQAGIRFADVYSVECPHHAGKFVRGRPVLCGARILLSIK